MTDEPTSPYEVDPPDPEPRSGRASLAEQRRAAEADLTVDLKVPEYEDVYVRYRPVDAPTIRRKLRKHDADKDAGLLKAYCELLIDACEGIFHLGDDGTEVGVDPDRRDEWPGYDHRLAELLGVKADSAIEVCRSVHVKDGHVYSLAGRLMEHSGFARSEIEERYRGN